jgi:hypothetical protein
MLTAISKDYLGFGNWTIRYAVRCLFEISDKPRRLRRLEARSRTYRTAELGHENLGT